MIGQRAATESAKHMREEVELGKVIMEERAFPRKFQLPKMIILLCDYRSEKLSFVSASDTVKGILTSKDDRPVANPLVKVPGEACDLH